MSKTVLIRNSNTEISVCISPQIKNVQHFLNQTQLFEFVLNNNPQKENFRLDQLILIDFSFIFNIQKEEIQKVIKYQILMSGSYSLPIRGFNGNMGSYKKKIVRLTSLSDFNDTPNKYFFNTIVALIESQNQKTTISAQEFFLFDRENLVKFDFENFNTSKFGLFISHSAWLYENDKSDTIKKIVLSDKDKDGSNTYYVRMHPSPNINLFGKPLSPISEKNSNLTYHQMGFYDAPRESHGFIEGPYHEIYKYFEDDNQLRKIIFDYLNAASNRNKSYNDIHDDIGWDQWNDDLDTDQQPEEFWNQF